MKAIVRCLMGLWTVMIASSCEEHEVEYNTTTVSSNMAEFQLHYFVPVTAVAANYIYRVEINDELYANSTAPLNTYNAIPSGSVGRFYTVESGTVNIKLYRSTEEVLVYDKDVTLTAGKQNIFVHDFDEVPIVFDNGYPYETNITEDTDSTCWVKFYNFLYETEGTPCDLKLQYQYIDPRTSEMVNIGDPVAFGETTGWQPIKIIKSVYNSSGYSRVDYRIKIIGSDGSEEGDLQLWNSNSIYTSYSDYWTGYIGRRYHHVLGGFRSAKPIASVRQFTAL